MMNQAEKKEATMSRIGVVGGGIVGSAIAAWLIAEGHNVALYEREPEGLPASAGNAGILALAEIAPLARPGILAQVPRWLLDPLGPLSLRLRDAPAFLPWLIGFLRSASRSHGEYAAAALAFLMQTALADHEELAKRTGMNGHFRRTGSLSIYDTEAGLRGAEAEWSEIHHHLGFVHERLTPERARALVPGLAGDFAGAIHSPDGWTVTDPLSILRAVQRRVAGHATLYAVPADRIVPGADGVSIAAADGTDERFDQVVIAAGVWSRDLVRQLGLKVRLEAERGYNTTYPGHPVSIPMPISFADHGFVVTPLENSLRVGGAVELAAVDAPPNFARAQAMRAKMRRYFPALPESGGTEWMGSRPATPDSLPVIGRHPGDPRILFAFGHGFLGLTLCAATARHIAGLIAGRSEPKLAPFGIERFQ
jgi:D-amino-acid dehydrogenase